MDIVIYYISIIGLLIIPLEPCFSQGSRDLELKAMVMDLVFLNAYKERLRAHGIGVVDESDKIQFFGIWEPILGSEKTNTIFEKIQEHLKYVLDIANNADSDISSLVIAIHTRILALNRGVNYLACIMFAQFHPAVSFKLEHCQNIAAHLLIFSHLGLEKLMKKFQCIVDSSVMDFNFGLPNMDKIAKDLPEIPVAVGLFVTSNLEEQIESEILKSTALLGNLPRFYLQAMYEIANHVSHIQYHGRLLLDMNCGAVAVFSLYRASRIYDSFSYHDDVPFWTDTSSGINENLEQNFSSNADPLKYGITTVIRENIIHRAMADGINRRVIAEMFDRVKPDHLKISVNVRRLVSNIRSWK